MRNLSGRVRFRFPASLLISALFATVLVVFLLGSVPDAVETPWVNTAPDWGNVPAELSATGAQPHEYVLHLHLDDPIAFLASPEIRLLFGSHGEPLRLADARLEALGTACSYATQPGADFAAGTELSLFRNDACQVLRTAPTGILQLSVHLLQPARIVLWTVQPPASLSIEGTIRIPGVPGPVFVTGKFVNPAPSTHTRRIDLLNYVWQLSPAPRWIWFIVFVVAALLALGGHMVSPALSDTTVPRWRLASRVGVGATCLTGALTLCYVVLVPPFQAPDEPDHFLAFANVTGRQELTAAAERWAQVMHFQRIRFRPTERFRVGDMGNPSAFAWDSAVHAENVSTRSAATLRVWSALGRVLRPASVQGALLYLRIANTLMFAAAVGLACALVVWCTTAPGAPGSPLAWFPFLFVPALPFFAMHVSEFSILTSLYVLMAAAGLILFLDGPRSYVAGAMIGLAGGVLMTGGRSAIPIAPVLVGGLVARAVLGQSGVTTRWAYARCAAIFWAGVPAGVLLFGLWSTALYRQDMAWQVRRIVRALAPSLGPWLFPMLETPGLILAAAVGIAVAGFVVEILVAWIRGHIGNLRLAGTAAMFMTRAAAVVLIGTMIWTAGPWLPRGPTTVGSDWEYAEGVLRTTLTGFRLHDPDVMLSSSFWVGFGWLEVFPPEPLVVALTTMTGVALAALLWRLGRNGDVRRVVFGAIYAAGWWGALMLYALSVHSVGIGLSGRYATGLYVCGLALVWSGLLFVSSSAARPASASGWWSGARQSALLLTVCGSVHAYCLSFILRRYF